MGYGPFMPPEPSSVPKGECNNTGPSTTQYNLRGEMEYVHLFAVIGTFALGYILGRIDTKPSE